MIGAVVAEGREHVSGLSIHAVDVAAGRPAEGLQVEVFRLEPERRLVASGRLGPSGALDDPVTTTRLPAGFYEVLFHLGAWAGPGGPAFLDVVPFRFRLADPDAHTHLPLKFTPWGYSLFRGS